MNAKNHVLGGFVRSDKRTAKNFYTKNILLFFFFCHISIMHEKKENCK